MKKKSMRVLLETVLDVKVKAFNEISNSKVWYTIPGDTLSSYVDVHKFQSKCKKWAAKRGYIIQSSVIPSIGGMASTEETEHMTDEPLALVLGKTEYKAVYKICHKVIGIILKGGNK